MILAVLLVMLAGTPGCGAADEPVPALPDLKLGIAYQPRGFRELPEVTYPGREEVIEDLRLLHSAGFRSLVTYAAADVLAEVPELARAQGFDGLVVMGVWDPSSDQEYRAAVAQSASVDGYCVGNEGLGVRYDAPDLALRMTALRRATGKPVTTSEPIHRYLGGPDRQWLLENSDWLFPIAHPYLALGRGDDEAVAWVVARYDYLSAASEKPVILKETGVPTQGGACCSQTAQLEFFKSLSRKRLSFYFFEAFDQPHKRPSGRDPEPEHHWGLYLADGTPKKVVDWLKMGGGGE